MSKILFGLPAAAGGRLQPVASRFAAPSSKAQVPRFEQSLAQASQQGGSDREINPRIDEKQSDAAPSSPVHEVKADRTSSPHDGASAEQVHTEAGRESLDAAMPDSAAAQDDIPFGTVVEQPAAVSIDLATLAIPALVDEAAVIEAGDAVDAAAVSGTTLTELPAQVLELITKLMVGAAQPEALASLLKDHLAAGQEPFTQAGLAQLFAAAGLAVGEAKGAAMLLEQSGGDAMAAAAVVFDETNVSKGDAAGNPTSDGGSTAQDSPLAKLIASLLAQAAQSRTASTGPDSEPTSVTAMETNAAARPSGQPAAPAAPPLPAGSATGDADVDADVNAARLARGLQSAVQQRGGVVTLRLTPPEMGTVRIEMQIRSGTVTAQFHTETAAARTMLNGQLAQLRQALESQGLSVERLGAQTMPSSSAHSAQNHAQQGEGDGRADGAPHDGRSRGQYDGRGDGSRGDGHEDAEGRSTAQSQPISFEQALNAVG